MSGPGTRRRLLTPPTRQLHAACNQRILALMASHQRLIETIAGIYWTVFALMLVAAIIGAFFYG